MIYKRGGIWWYRIKFGGAIIRETTKSTSKTVAREAERTRHRQLEEAYDGTAKRKRKTAVFFATAANAWLASKSAISDKSRLGYEQRMVYVTKWFGKRLVADIDEQDVVRLHRGSTESKGFWPHDQLRNLLCSGCAEARRRLGFDR